MDHPEKESDTVADPHEAPVEDNSSIPKEQAVDSSLTDSDKVVGLGDSREEHVKDDSSIPKTEEKESNSAHPEEQESTSANPEEKESTSAHPEERESTSAHPEEKNSTSAHPKEKQLTSAHPEENESISAHPEENESSSAHPEEEEVDTLGDALVAYVEVEIDPAILNLHPFLEFATYRVNNVIVGRDRRVLFHNFAEQQVRRQDIRYQGLNGICNLHGPTKPVQQTPILEQ